MKEHKYNQEGEGGSPPKRPRHFHIYLIRRNELEIVRMDIEHPDIQFFKVSLTVLLNVVKNQTFYPNRNHTFYPDRNRTFYRKFIRIEITFFIRVNVD